MWLSCVGYWISHSAIKTVYDHEDGFCKSPHNIAAIQDVVYTKFNVSKNVIMYWHSFSYIIANYIIMNLWRMVFSNNVHMPHMKPHPAIFGSDLCLCLCHLFFDFVQLKDRYDILPHIYENFSKTKIAQLCKDIARRKLSHSIISFLIVGSLLLFSKFNHTLGCRLHENEWVFSYTYTMLPC